MANQIAVNTVKLGNDASDISAHIANIVKKIDEMQTSVSDLDAMWDGPSSEAFKKVFAQDMKAMKEIINGLKDVNQYESNAKSKYEACERQVSNLISAIKI